MSHSGNEVEGGFAEINRVYRRSISAGMGGSTCCGACRWHVNCVEFGILKKTSWFAGDGFVGVCVDWGPQQKRCVIVNMHAPCEISGGISL